MFPKHINVSLLKYFKINYIYAKMFSKYSKFSVVSSNWQQNKSNTKILPKSDLCILKTLLSTQPPPDSKSQCIPQSASGGSTGSRVVRQEPGKVRLGFVPDEWFMFFYKKTGVTGSGTFCFTVMITLMSKEHYILEHEYYGGLSMALLCILSVKYIGPLLAKFIDKEIDEYEQDWKVATENNKKAIEDAIKFENKQQLSMEGQLILVEAKRENVHLQLEAAYRQRLMHAYEETKKRLEYCLSREMAEKALARRTMGIWVVQQVKASITKEIEEKALSKCLEDLKNLAKTYEGLSAPYKPADPPNDPDKSKSKL